MDVVRRRQLSNRRRLVVWQGNQAEGDDERPLVVGSSASRVANKTRSGGLYASNVRHTLRQRVFGWLPISRQRLAATYATVIIAIAVLWTGDWLARKTDALANAPEIARPLRLAEHQSLATYFAACAFALAAAVSYLIHQIQGHHAHDYRGHYRWWRVVLAILLLASVNAVVNLHGVAAAVCEACMPDPPVIAGSEIVRLAVWLSSTIALVWFGREVRDSRLVLALVTLLLGVTTGPALSHWGLLGETAKAWSSNGQQLARIAIPGLCLLIMLTYVRHLYRLARGLTAREGRPKPTGSTRAPSRTARQSTTVKESSEEASTGPSWRERWRMRFRRSDSEAGARAESTKRSPPVPEPGGATSPSPSATASTAPTRPGSSPVAGATPRGTPTAVAAPPSATTEKSPAKPAASVSSAETAADRPRRRWWPFGYRAEAVEPKSGEAKPASPRVAQAAAPKPTAASPSPQKPGSPPASAPGGGQPTRSAAPAPTNRPGNAPPITVQPRPPVHDPGDDEDDDEPSDGTSRMSKAERKRLRRLQRRDDRAA
jgi:hypothetical protein